MIARDSHNQCQCLRDANSNEANNQQLSNVHNRILQRHTHYQAVKAQLKQCQQCSNNLIGVVHSVEAVVVGVDFLIVTRNMLVIGVVAIAKPGVDAVFSTCLR